MIASGEKKEEYRQKKPYWISRLVEVFGPKHSCEDFNFEHLGFTCSLDTPVYYDIARFKNGYNKSAPEMDVEILDIDVNCGKEKWGAKIGESYFVIKLGQILSIKNYTPDDSQRVLLQRNK
jgi:hypothetical protein